MHLAEYLFRRLRQINIRSVFGVPGDYNLIALDYVEDCGLEWVGNVNELNAGYAADGYARVKGISAIVTTFGVGELSAINALAGANAELVPIIHIVGFPSTAAKTKGLAMHHTLGDGDYNVFMEMSARISSAIAYLDDPMKAPELIDKTIVECYRSSKPVYIALPMDLIKSEVDASGLDEPLILRNVHRNSPEDEELVIKAIHERIDAAQNPIIIVDSLAGRYDSLQSTRMFVESSALPCYIFPMAKGIIDETLPTFRGVYAGDVTEPNIREQIQSSDLILLIGSRPTDFNTGFFKSDMPQIETISLQRNEVRFKDRDFPELCMDGVLDKLSDVLRKSMSNSTSSSPSIRSPTFGSDGSTASAPGTSSLKGPALGFQGNKLDSTTLLTQEWLWQRVSKWFEEDDVVSLEVGTSAFGALWTRHPRGTKSLFQLLWSSIGFALGATVGAALAVRELEQENQLARKRRTILFTGDGSLQMTAQEISTLVRQKLGVIIFVICNEGYTIERMIHGADKKYNDIQSWDYQLLPKVFNPEPHRLRTYSVHTKGDLDLLLRDPQFGPADDTEGDQAPLRLVEVHLAKEDGPWALHGIINAVHGK